MTLSFDAARVQGDERAHRLTRRLLGGAGAASLDAYRLGECVAFVAHGMAADGSLVVAARPEGVLASVDDGDGIDVRLDVVKQSPDPSISIVGSSVHLLGVLRWLPSDRLHELPGLPPLVEAMMDVPGSRLGIISIGRAVLHDLLGPTPIALEQIHAEDVVIQDDHLGFELVAAHGQAELKDLCWAVMVGAARGVVVSKAPLPAVCPHTADRVFCVDVDTMGVTLMLVGREETLLVFAAFSSRVSSQFELDDRISELMSEVGQEAA